MTTTPILKTPRSCCSGGNALNARSTLIKYLCSDGASARAMLQDLLGSASGYEGMAWEDALGAGTVNRAAAVKRCKDR